MRKFLLAIGLLALTVGLVPAAEPEHRRPILYAITHPFQHRYTPQHGAAQRNLPQHAAIRATASTSTATQVFSVSAYGAVAATAATPVDATVGIRAAVTAAIAYTTANPTAQAYVVFQPGATYYVCNQPADVAWHPIINLSPTAKGGAVNNLNFVGNNTSIVAMMPGLQPFNTSWFATSAPPASNVPNGVTVTVQPSLMGGSSVGHMPLWGINASVNLALGPITNITFTGFNFTSNSTYTGLSGLSFNPATPNVFSNGFWYTSDKVFYISATLTAPTHGITISNCTMGGFNGELLYAGGSEVGSITSIGNTYGPCNADAISCSAAFTSVNDVIGTTPPTGFAKSIYNGLENFATVATPQTIAGVTLPPQSTTIRGSTIQYGGNGVVLIGAPGTQASVTGSIIQNNNKGILLSEAINNLTVSGNTFNNNAQDMITSILGLYPGLQTGFNGVTLSGNSSSDNFLGMQNSISGLVISSNTLTGTASKWPVLVTGAQNLGSTNTITGNTLINAIDVSANSTPATFANWSGTVRKPLPPATAVSIYSYGVKAEGFAQGVTTGLVTPISDVTMLNANLAGKGIPFVCTLPATTGYPVGFTTTFLTNANTGGGPWQVAVGGVNVPVVSGQTAVTVNASGNWALAP